MLRSKYLAPGETGPLQSWTRIARAMASVETDNELWYDRFFSLLMDFKFIPGGRVMHGAGREEGRVAWKRLMKRYHPDLHAADPDKRRIADQLAAELTRAYQQLDSLLAETAA